MRGTRGSLCGAAWWLLLAVGEAGLAGTAVAQEVVEPAVALERVALELRVVGPSAAPSDAVQAGLAPAGVLWRIDRGARQGVALGDPVELLPKGGPTRTGEVVWVETGTALVRLVGEDVALVPGVPGRVRVLLPEAPVVEPAAETEAAPTGEDEPDERPEWLRLRESWTPDQPLLSRVNAERPEERPFTWGGRWFTRGGLALGLDGDRGSATSRTGLVLWSTNPFGLGGRMDVDTELDMTSSWVPDEDGDGTDRVHTRVDRLAYHLGGTRQAPSQHSFGRFLHELPEFGVQDGYAWSTRLEGGDRFGASLGWRVSEDVYASPEAAPAAATWYRWVADERERLSASAGFMKSWYTGDRDRDLVVLRLDHRPDVLPAEAAWDLHGRVELDHYSGEGSHADGLALTRLLVETRRSAPADQLKGPDLGLGFLHQEHPEQDFGELEPLGLASLLRESEDRAWVDGGAWLSESRRLFGSVGVWSAGGFEDDAGGDLQLGLELTDLPAYGPGGPEGTGTGELTVFASSGRYQASNGVVASYGRRLENIGWQLAYELQSSDFEGFDADNDDHLQHRLRTTADLLGGAGSPAGPWYLAGHADLIVDGEEGGLVLGLSFGRSL